MAVGGFAYNALGEVLAQSDARGIATTLTYDKLGRPKTRTALVDVTGDAVADAVNDSWSYDPANAKGAPLSDQRTINGTLERSTAQIYDSLARPIQRDVTQALSGGTQSYRTRTKYDSCHGRPGGAGISQRRSGAGAVFGLRPCPGREGSGDGANTCGRTALAAWTQ